MRDLATTLFVLLALGVPARSAVFRVGPGGDHATIQEGVDAALGSFGSHEIRVAAGTFEERVRIDLSAGITLDLSGEWSADFSTRGVAATIVDGRDGGPVFEIGGFGGRLTVSKLSVTGGRGGSWSGGLAGAGFLLSLFGDAAVELLGNDVFANHVSGGPQLRGAGLAAGLRSDAQLTLRENKFRQNTLTSADPSSRLEGGGAWIDAHDRCFVAVLDNDFLENEADGSFVMDGAGLWLFLRNQAKAAVEDNRLRLNRTGDSDVQTSALRLVAGDHQSAQTYLGAYRNLVADNELSATGTSAFQVTTHSGGDSTLVFSDSVIARSNRHGVAAGSTGGINRFTNVTITGHREWGFAVSFPSAPLLSNSVVYDNGTDVAGTAVLTANLIGVDPGFVDGAAGDYHLAAGSPGIDAGDNAAPGGLGPLDLDREPRVQGPAVDIGAYEDSGPDGPGPGGGSGTDRMCRVLWADPPVDRYTNACQCATDRTVFAMRCALNGPELFAILNFPLLPDFPGGPVPAEWTLHPWQPMAGPYRMEMQALIDREWRSQPWYGPTARGLEDGVLVKEFFKIETAAGTATPLRIRIEYQRPGEKRPTVGLVRVLLPTGRKAPRK